MRTDGRRDVSTAEAERSSPLQPVGPLLMCMCTSVYIFHSGPTSVVGPRRSPLPPRPRAGPEYGRYYKATRMALRAKEKMLCWQNKNL